MRPENGARSPTGTREPRGCGAYAVSIVSSSVLPEVALARSDAPPGPRAGRFFPL
ncbi:hypothetical protein Scani_70070 [Streptomyces caniferus]|uniref:Uncharacterized protein n=1 Tax=Streptomyces caniferus TaxID=285557 RepID=A0A640SHB2_9ACTN|nr:hypothetical protein Scani_70070 [Streptomyces caniferus]